MAKKPKKKLVTKAILIGNVVDYNGLKCLVSYVHAEFCDLIPFDGSTALGKIATSSVEKLAESVDDYFA